MFVSIAKYDQMRSMNNMKIISQKYLAWKMFLSVNSYETSKMTVHTINRIGNHKAKVPPAVCISAWHIRRCLRAGFTCVWACIFPHCWECSGQALSNRPRLWAAHRSYSGELHCRPCHTTPHSGGPRTLGELLPANQKLTVIWLFHYDTWTI